MSGRTDPPDWLDELYQQDNAENPPASLDDALRSAAREPLQPWYRQPSRLATAATLILATGIVTLWLNEPELTRPSPASAAVETTVRADSDESPTRTAAAQRADSSAGGNAQLRKIAEAATQQEDLEQSLPPQESQLEADRSLRSSNELRSLSAKREAAGLTLKDMASAAPVQPAASPQAAAAPPPCNTTSSIRLADEQSYSICEQAGETTIAHADCASPYPLQGRHITKNADGSALLLTDKDRSWLLSCTNGEWLLSPLSEQ